MSVWKVAGNLRERQKKVCLLSGCAWMSRVPCLTFHSECIQPRMSRFVAQKATTWKEHVRDGRNGTAFLKRIWASSSLSNFIRVFPLMRLRPLNCVVVTIDVYRYLLVVLLTCHAVQSSSQWLIGRNVYRQVGIGPGSVCTTRKQTGLEGRMEPCFLCQALIWPRWWDPHVMIYVLYMYILDTVWVRQDTIYHGFARKNTVISDIHHDSASHIPSVCYWRLAFITVTTFFCNPTGVLVFFPPIYIPQSFPNSSQTPMYFAPAVCFPWSRCGISAALSCLGMCWCCTWSRWGEGERSIWERDPAKKCVRCSRTQ